MTGRPSMGVTVSHPPIVLGLVAMRQRFKELKAAAK